MRVTITVEQAEDQGYVLAKASDGHTLAHLMNVDLQRTLCGRYSLDDLYQPTFSDGIYRLCEVCQMTYEARLRRAAELLSQAVVRPVPREVAMS